MDNYNPPFTITNTMLDYISSIMEKIGKIDNYTYLEKMPNLRRNNKIKSIHSSLAIEANSLSLSEVKDVIAGKYVLGPQKEIKEVLNAYKAYEMIKEVNPYSLKDLKMVHGVMTEKTIELSGKFRTDGEGVFDSKGHCIHVCPPAKQVEPLMTQLFNWIKNNKDTIHPLILSSVFHYEFVFIHPFADGNGRMARLWQNILLTNWKELFEYLPIETRIKEYQSEYYAAISHCHETASSNEFIEFMLKMIDEVLLSLVENAKETLTEKMLNINKLLNVMKLNVPMSAYEIMEKLEIKSKETLRSKYLDPAIEEGLILLTIPDKPTSKNQMYYKVK